MLPKPKPDNAFTIREMHASDVADVSAFAARIWMNHYVPDIVTAEQIRHMHARMLSEESFAKILKDPAQKIWLLFVDENLAGYITLAAQEKGCWFLDKLYVDSARQRGGLGASLLDHAIAALKPRKLLLRVNRKNYTAVNFYFKQGFAITALDVKDIGGGFVMDDFLMERAL